MNHTAWALAGCMLAAGLADGGQSVASGEQMAASRDLLWYRHPAKQWKEALPIGNGRLGAMVLGGVARDRLALNHTRLWRRKLQGRENPKVAHHLPAIRKLFFEGKTAQAAKAANRLLGTQKVRGVDSYQPVGDLWLQFPDHKEPAAYRRQLDLSTGVASVSYRHGGAAFTRECFASSAQGVLVVRLAADRPGALTGSVALSRQNDPDCALTPWGEGSRIGFVGKFREGVRFAAAVAVVLEGGRLAEPRSDTLSASIGIEGADEALVLLSIATGQEAGEPKALAAAQLDKACSAPDYATLRDDHVAAHRRL